jgi:hypothetical protein
MKNGGSMGKSSNQIGLFSIAMLEFDHRRINKNANSTTCNARQTLEGLRLRKLKVTHGDTVTCKITLHQLRMSDETHSI